jgi:hypothetical protein
MPKIREREQDSTERISYRKIQIDSHEYYKYSFFLQENHHFNLYFAILHC